jgi:hypothetical protein
MRKSSPVFFHPPLSPPAHPTHWFPVTCWNQRALPFLMKKQPAVFLQYKRGCTLSPPATLIHRLRVCDNDAALLIHAVEMMDRPGTASHGVGIGDRGRHICFRQQHGFR